MQPYYIHPGSLLNAISVEEKTALGGVIFLQNEFNKKVTWKTELKQNEEIFSIRQLEDIYLITDDDGGGGGGGGDCDNDDDDDDDNGGGCCCGG